ncbi:hypothetical protein ACHAWF_001205 [Thalassiosira exigua]
MTSVPRRLLALLSAPPPPAPSGSGEGGGAKSTIPNLDDDGGGAAGDFDFREGLERWSDGVESSLLSPGGGGLGEGEEDGEGASSEVRKAADALHRAIVAEVDPVRRQCREDDDDDEASEAALEIAREIGPEGPGGVDPARLAALLRAAGILMRWRGQTSRRSRPPPSDGTTSPLARLRSEGALLLYSKLLDSNVSPADEGADGRPDVPRFASICIFRATFGDDPSSSAARKAFVAELDGCSYLSRALLRGDQPTSRLFSVVRNVHHLISACPAEAIPRLEGALEDLTVKQSGDGNESDAGNEGNDGNGQKHGMAEVLVATLAWAFRSNPPFPVDRSDRRPDLVMEILRALYALDSCHPSKRRPPKAVMVIALADLLRLPSSDARCYGIKLAVVPLLLNAPREYEGYLVERGAIKPLADVLSYQTRRRGRTDTACDAMNCQIEPIDQGGGTGQSVFPDAKEVFRAKAATELANGGGGKVGTKNMAPLDAPGGTLRWKLIRLMTHVESKAKRGRASCSGRCATAIRRRSC